RLPDLEPWIHERAETVASRWGHRVSKG
ncbi:MAG: hypothetical protein JWQ32_2566, partial [Marmoricola sp.]|nr:hypothetical protein [Marmoricola sp.]